MDPKELALRGGIAVFAGTLIGLERLWRHKEAALKTNTLVALGAAIFGMIGTESYRYVNWSASQFSMGVIAGVGFLGSGIIMRQQGHLQGINSAATVWVSAGVGLASGMGEYAIAYVCLPMIILVQFVHRKIESKVKPSTENQ